MHVRSFVPVALLLAGSLVGCAAAPDDGGDDTSSDITSNAAQIIDLDLDGTVVGAKGNDARQIVVSQLFYTIGALTTQYQANGHVGQVVLSSVTETAAGEAKTIKYHAKLPVAWPKGVKVPRTYDVVLPRDVTKLDAFNAKYDGTCGKNEYGQETFWHDFNPKAAGCKPDAADVVSAKARITKDPSVTTGKFPEYDRVWSDGALNVVAIFGEASGGAPGDEGAAQFEQFVSGVMGAIPGATSAANKTSASFVKDVTVTGKVRAFGGTKPVVVTALLMDTLYTSGEDFDARYNPLSEKADFVVYNGHSELSKNTNALARKGVVAKGQYQMFFFDSCDTFAYLDTALTQRRIDANGSAADPKGTKNLDVLTNVLPSYFSNYASSSITVLKALMTPDAPKTYNAILADLPADQTVVVTGEEDNAFHAQP
jgi:hypothetical protein